ncbi:Protein phosphatase 1A (Protein phosphatase 2C isoform alpha) (PP2C-alpha) (Protein phosphatase IA) [Durusdinium trenchii]|uniref:Protein phosphatase 1A (Protein phosphatase 2C isoform alpha) (PP2C-alpha) (Protein phosphatase IA) n=1 Tax=Durusdinium trenchii TaxID=1381693 RepID=A0ABP0M3D6_9DINO
MGAILSEPVTAMVIEHCSSSSWSAAAVTMQGVFAVLDGHGGSSAASGGARLLEEALKKVAFSGTLSGKSELEVQNILEEAFLDTDLRLRSHLEPEDRSGSTVVACILVPMDTSDSPHRFTVQLAHAGDSRAVLSRQGTLFCSKDHKPNREDETRRIEAAGGCVSQGPLGGGPMRVDGALAVSRALGDFHFKPKELDASKCKVSAVPEVQVVEGCSAGDWVLLACDGIFDVMENEEVRAFVEEHPSKSSEDIDAGQLCIDLLKRCLDKGSKDNCTACFIHFGKAPVKGRPSSELLQGGWRGASPEVQCKYAEFFRDHGFEAQASEIVVGRRSSKGPTAAPGERENGTSRSLSSFTRVLQAVRSTRAIQSAWRARKMPGVPPVPPVPPAPSDLMAEAAEKWALEWADVRPLSGETVVLVRRRERGPEDGGQGATMRCLKGRAELTLSQTHVRRNKIEAATRPLRNLEAPCGISPILWDLGGAGH